MSACPDAAVIDDAASSDAAASTSGPEALASIAGVVENVATGLQTELRTPEVVLIISVVCLGLMNLLAQSMPRRWAMRQLKRRREGSDRRLYRAARRLWEVLGVKPRTDQWQAAAVSKPSDEVTSAAVGKGARTADTASSKRGRFA